MTKPNIKLILKLALIMQEHSEEEMRAALAAISRVGGPLALIEFLTKDHTICAERAASTPATKPIYETVSRSVLKLREIDPEKFRVLSEFDLMVRRGQLLDTNESIRRFGERISKDFQPRKARRETISSLMNVMAERPLGEIENLIEFAASFGVTGNTDDYQRLAQYLIRGKQ